VVDQLLPKLTGVDHEATSQPILLQGGVSSGPVTTDRTAKGDSQSIAIQAAHSLGGSAIAADQIAHDEARPQTTVIQRNGSGAGWIIVVGPRAAPRIRLFCFPFAGGGSAVYRNWAQSIDPGIEVVAIEPPGRLGRITETPIADINEFVEQLLPEMRGLLDRPFVFFGHCLGALTMYETTRRLIRTTTFRPDHLFVSGARPPDRLTDQG